MVRFEFATATRIIFGAVVVDDRLVGIIDFRPHEVELGRGLLRDGAGAGHGDQTM